MYQAAVTAGGAARVESVPLIELASVTVTPISTLYVPALGLRPLDDAVLAAVGVGPEARAASHVAVQRRAELLAALGTRVPQLS